MDEQYVHLFQSKWNRTICGKWITSDSGIVATHKHNEVTCPLCKMRIGKLIKNGIIDMQGEMLDDLIAKRVKSLNPYHQVKPIDPAPTKEKEKYEQ